MGRHTDFIRRNIEVVLEEAKSASSNIIIGIETYPLIGYLLQSVFIQMTGFQEQKFKCIAWEMANENFDFRFKFLKSMSSTGFSDIDSKTQLFSELKKLAEIKEIDEHTKQKLIDSAQTSLVNILNDSILINDNQRQFNLFLENMENDFTTKDICINNNLFKQNSKIATIYSKLYKQRNRIAHNSISYQHNLPTLKELEKELIYDRNYFSWFFCLILIDKIMIYLYEQFLEKQENEPYI